MASDPQPTARAHRPTLAITEAGSRRAVLAVSGRLDSTTLGELEGRLTDPRLLGAHEVVLEMDGLDHLDLACAYALLRAATGRPENAVLTVRGADRTVLRTLHSVGLDAVAVIEE
ncbi:STAS domain-containing protein [Streptomyces sp. S1A]|uniref:STAS domain-containing protein n=1 Tax=Streptomyces sp. ICN903 TaxID=2964654 RepID=UPI001EDAC665|nr:STAS domain-containing protein [Streptomyces sp. ICN903]MCG3043437.1 STAS domain-containing protein [Streptomyces sp. ICN903]